MTLILKWLLNNCTLISNALLCFANSKLLFVSGEDLQTNSKSPNIRVHETTTGYQIAFSRSLLLSSAPTETDLVEEDYEWHVFCNLSHMQQEDELAICQKQTKL